MAENILMPTLGLTMTEGTVDQWFKNVGDTVEKGEVVCSISSEKLTHDVEATIAGELLQILVEAGGDAPCQAAIGVIGEKGEQVGTTEVPVAEKEIEKETEKAEATSPVTSEPAAASKRVSGGKIFATPVARKIAQEKNYDLADIPGTGGNGRITRRDVENYQAPVAAPAQGQGKVFAAAGEGLTGMRKVIAQRMSQSLQVAAQLTIQRKANITQLLAFRETLKGEVGSDLNRGTISLNTLLVKAVSLALQAHPEMNAWYDGQSHQVLGEIHLGIAVSVPDGLVVPVLKNAENKSLSSLAADFANVTSGAQKGTLASDLYSGSTFTISNLGRSGVEYFTPILNTPEVGILGVGTSSTRLSFNAEREIVEVTELPLSLTFDHQVIDGTPAGEFLQTVCHYLENPFLLVL